MAKRFREPIAVTTTADAGEPAPVTFHWRGGVYRVLAVLGHWREDAGHWAGGGVAIPQRDLWRVEARAESRNGAGDGRARPGVYEVVCDDGCWRLHRVWD